MSSSEQDERSDGTESDDERNQNRNLFQAIRDRDLRKFEQHLIQVKDINKIIDYNNRNNTLLHYAVYKNENGIVRELICSKWKADLNARNSHGNTPLHVAALKGHKEHVRALLNAGADSSMRNKKLQTALELAKDREIKDMLTVQSQAGTSGMDASKHLKQQQKRKEFCNAYTQPKRSKNSLERKRSNDEDSHESKKLKTSEDYRASGLKSSLHGVAYQLKLLMLCMKRGVDNGYSFRLATEMDAAEKFDDLVFQYKEGKKILHRFLQAKHKQNESENISTNDLLTQTDGNFSLQKYFISYRKIKRNPEFNGANNEIKDMIICTNIGFKLGDKRGELTLSKDIFDIERDDTVLQTDILRLKKDFVGRKDIVSILKNASDLMKLAKRLFDCVFDDTSTKKVGAKKDAKDDLLNSYEFALVKEVIDEYSKKLRHEFVTNAESLSSEARNFRKAFEYVFHDRRKTYNLDSSRVIESEDLENFAQEVAELIQKADSSGKIIVQKRKKVIKNNFDKLAGYVLVEKACEIKFSSAFLNNKGLPGNLDDFRKSLFSKLPKTKTVYNNMAQYRFKVYDSFKTCDEIYVDTNTFWDVIKERELNLSDNFGKWNANLEIVDVFVEQLVHLIEESRNNDQSTVQVKGQDITFSKNINKLAKCAFIEESDGIIRFSPQFLENDLLLDNLNKFRDQLKARVKDIGELRFAINNFPKSRLPNDSITDIDSDIDSFLDKLVFAVNQPNEIKLGDTIYNEMAECRDINLIDSEFLASYYQKYMYDWMKDKKGRFLTSIEGKNFFDEMAKKLTTLQLTGLTREYRFIMKQMNIRFTKDEIELRKFLKPENTMQLFILRSMPDAIFGLIQVHQILEKMSDYQKDDSYIFIRYDSFSCMQDLVVNAFCSRSEHLLIIKYKSYEDGHQTSHRMLYEAIKSNRTRKLILITEKDNELANTLTSMFSARSVVGEIKVNGLFDLDDESRNKIIKQSNVKFQGQEVPLSKLMMSEKSTNLINAEALSKLVNNETLEVGKLIQDLGDVGNYYITRTFQRCENIDRSFQNDKSRFHVISNNQPRNLNFQRNRDIVVISDNSDLFEELSHRENSNKCNIHWLKSEYGKFIWRESNGALSNLRSIVDRGHVKSCIPEKVTDVPKKIAIISAEPGMGKSTVLTHLAVQTKISEPTTWVAKINLSADCSKKLREMIDNRLQFDSERTIDFLLSSAKLWPGTLEREFFKDFYQRGEMILLFDGFDEISPLYTNKFMELLKFLKDTKVKKIWVTTRPYNIRNNLEDELSSFSYMLKEFSEYDQKRFLKEFWKTRLNSNNFDDKRADVFIDILFTSFAKSINDRERKFISIPLQIRMIADVCQEIFRNFHESHEVNVPNMMTKFGESLELINLYENFFNVKFKEIRFGEKKPGWNSADTDSIHIMETEIVSDVERHEKLALENLYPQNKMIPRETIVSLMKDIELGKNKTGIIDHVADNKPIFVHKSFAEYFVALWFSKNWHEENVKEFLRNHIFSETSMVIQNFLDRILAKNEPESIESLEFHGECPRKADRYVLQKAVLDNNLSEVERLLDEDKSFLHTTDKAGRTLLHLAATCVHKEIAQSLLEAVRTRVDQNILTHALSVKDKLFEWTPLTYADKKSNWNVAELLLQMGAAGVDMLHTIENLRLGVLNSNGQTLLHTAAENGHLKIAKLLLKEGAMIDARDKEARTPLHLASRRGQLEMLKYLCEKHDANFEATDGQGSTPLHYAVEIGDLEMSKYLVDEKNADLDVLDNDGRTPLHVAAINGKTDIVRYLVDEKKADFEAFDYEGWTPLHVAASHGTTDLVRYLVDEKNANFEAVDEEGFTPLHAAASNGNTDLVRYLIDEKNTNFEIVDAEGCTPLHVAGSYGNTDLVRYLIDEKNANFEAVNAEGHTLLHITAMDADNLEIVRYLVDEKNANFEAVDEEGCTPLHVATLNGNLEVVKYLVGEKDANFEAVTKEGCTPLHIAASKGYLELVKYLADEKNANCEAVDEEGWTPLHVAALHHKTDIVRYLVDEKNANFETVNAEGYTLLHIAASNDDLEIVRYLVDEKNANLEAVDREGRTPLHAAILADCLKVVEYLVYESNANCEAIDRNGYTPLHFAASKGKLEIVKHLIDKKNANLEAMEDGGCTPLHVATFIGNLEVVEYLVGEKDANFEAVTKEGCTPLHIAALKGYLELVKYLVDEKNANCEAVDEEGWTPLHVAASHGHMDLVRYFIDEKNANFEAVNAEGHTLLHIASEEGNLEMVKYLVDEKNADLKAVDKKGRTPLHIAAEESKLEIVEYLTYEETTL